MRIHDFRPSFNVFVLDSQPDRSFEVINQLKLEGYTTYAYEDEQSLRRDLLGRPPHMLFFHFEDDAFESSHLVSDILAQVPEVHIFVLCSQSNWQKAMQLYDKGIFDCIQFPLNSVRQVVFAADKAAQSDYYMYMNEQLRERLGADPAPVSDNRFVEFDSWLGELENQSTYELALDHFVTQAAKFSGVERIVYFKYIDAHKTLVAAKSSGPSMDDLRGIGLDLREEEGDFDDSDLRRPSEVAGLNELVNAVFGQQDFTALPLEVCGSVKGVFIILGQPMAANDKQYLQTCLRALDHSFVRIGLQKRLHSINLNDDDTQVLNRQSFLSELSREVSRARRTKLPTSVLILSVDDMQSHRKQYGDVAADQIIKTVASMLKKFSRVNDIVGRLSADEFALVLPHTNQKGGAIKAERIRRIVESLDFSRIWPNPPKVTLSVGVSEYPSHSHDADEVIQAADEALFEVKQAGKNRVCLASAADGFAPDFAVDMSTK